MFEGDNLAVRIFTCADWAALTQDGKLCIGGGGIDRVFLESIPGNLPTLHLVIRVHIPWGRTLEEHPLSVQVMESDRKPIGPPIDEGRVEVGRPPGSRPGDELAMQGIVPIAGYPVPSKGTFFIHLTVSGQLLGLLPFRVLPRLGGG